MLHIGDLINIKKGGVDSYSYSFPLKGIVCEIIGILYADHSENYNKMDYYIIGSHVQNDFFSEYTSNIDPSITISTNEYPYHGYYSVTHFNDDFTYQIIQYHRPLFRVINQIQNELI